MLVDIKNDKSAKLLYNSFTRKTSSNHLLTKIFPSADFHFLRSTACFLLFQCIHPARLSYLFYQYRCLHGRYSQAIVIHDELSIFANVVAEIDTALLMNHNLKIFDGKSLVYSCNKDLELLQYRNWSF